MAVTEVTNRVGPPDRVGSGIPYLFYNLADGSQFVIIEQMGFDDYLQFGGYTPRWRVESFGQYRGTNILWWKPKSVDYK